MGRTILSSISVLILAMFMTSFCAAEYSIDISGLKNDEYKLSEEINFKVILLDGEELVEKDVEVRIYDAFEKNERKISTKSNKETSIKVEKNFTSGIWTMEASFQESSIARTFNIGENSVVEFELEGDTLTIKNVGNSRYTKTIQLTIGGETKSYAQNLGINEKKVLKLISPDGIYDITVTDGVNTLKRENIQLFGTGNVVGAIDEGLIGYTGFAGVGDPEELDERGYSMAKVPLTVVFIFAVIVVAVLITIERKMSKRRQQQY